MGLTQTQLGALLGTTGVTIMRYEKGQRTPGVETLQQIAKLLNVEVITLLGLDDLEREIVNVLATTDEKDWVQRSSTNEGVIILPREFNEFERFVESIGYRTTLREGQYYIVRLGDEKNGTPVTVEELRELVRTSKATVGALVKSLMEKAAQTPDDPSETFTQK